MQPLSYIDGELHCEDVATAEIARAVGTPAYVYSAYGITERYQSLQRAFPGALICFSVKSNANRAILRLLADRGSGFDIVSMGELARVIAAGGDPRKTVFAGVGKTDEEIRFALESSILSFNVESLQELWNIATISREMGRQAPISMRINPDVDAHTHSHLTTATRGVKFGMDLDEAVSALDELPKHPGLQLVGVHIHLGSQIPSPDPYVQAIRKAGQFVPAARKKGFQLRYFNIGGGFSIRYAGEEVPSFQDFADAILPEISSFKLELLMEPGRSIVGSNGILLTKVLYVDQTGGKNCVICDAGMNDLIRPVLYDAYHKIWPISAGKLEPSESDVPVDIVGPICEPGDAFARARKLPHVRRGDILAIFCAGAYGFTMASNYNSRPRACEVLVHGRDFSVVKTRENLEDLMRGEISLEHVQQSKLTPS